MNPHLEASSLSQLQIYPGNSIHDKVPMINKSTQAFTIQTQKVEIFM